MRRKVGMSVNEIIVNNMLKLTDETKDALKRAQNKNKPTSLTDRPLFKLIFGGKAKKDAALPWGEIVPMKEHEKWIKKTRIRYLILGLIAGVLIISLI